MGYNSSGHCAGAVLLVESECQAEGSTRLGRGADSERSGPSGKSVGV